MNGTRFCSLIHNSSLFPNPRPNLVPNIFWIKPLNLNNKAAPIPKENLSKETVLSPAGLGKTPMRCNSNTMILSSTLKIKTTAKVRTVRIVNRQTILTIVEGKVGKEIRVGSKTSWFTRVFYNRNFSVKGFSTVKTTSKTSRWEREATEVIWVG